MTISFSRPSRIDALTTAVRGSVITPGDTRYETAAAAWNLAWTHRPAAVVVPADEDDVVVTLAYARQLGLSVAVQTTGHGVVVPADEQSILMVMSAFDGVRIDPAARTATMGGGVTWRPVLAAAQEHGLAPLLGSAPHVGAVGYTVGGGTGWLARHYGLAVDSVRSLRVVLADGRVVVATAESSPELFWGLCGAGGGTLGVIVEMTVALAPVDEVYAGNLFYPVDAALDVFDRFRTRTADAPTELTSAFNITAFPPLDIVPEPLRGQTFAIFRGCHSGDLAEGKAMVDEWRRWRSPLLDTFGVLPFARCAEISQDPVDPLPAATSGRWLHEAGTNVGEAMIDAVVGDQPPSPVLFAELRHAGGAISTPNPHVSFDARTGAYVLELVGLIMSPEADVELEQRFGHTWERLAENLATLPGYLNFTEGQERHALARHAFAAGTRDRLARLKQDVDPSGIFRHGIGL
ncbi:FAD-binding oxidoreductase [Phytoactinopolyspora limicola]|uniref:FAD-binding oxidoreductase n=1 Tax=Phytoactinopolyspora limicola TaxID=2715536 RepID=UPI001409AEDF|nr:FAD-binding oxidoreductase [Phytoactinopolyspora limicola]